MAKGSLVLGSAGTARRGGKEGYVDVKESGEKSVRAVYRPEG